MTITHYPIRKDGHGNWHAETTVDLGPRGDSRRELTISTSKRYHGVMVTHASIGHVKDGMVTHAMFSDFSVRLAASKGRCTDKAINAQHAAHTSDERIAQLAKAVAEHYQQEVAA